MRIDFEVWINNQSFSQDAKALFDESIKCYRVAAYRSAYLMSYIGFLVVIKDRVLMSEKPTSISDDQWENDVLKKLRCENKWEDHTYNLLNKKDRNNRSLYFLVSTHILNDLDYFRRRRNDCAHAKDTIIDYSHVEVFWNFLKSHLSKFVINGGKEALISKINKHFDSRFTDPNSDISYLINEIPLVVEKTQISTLLQEINEECFPIGCPFNEEKSNKLWGNIVYHENVELQEGLAEFLFDCDNETFSIFMLLYPDKIGLFDSNSEKVRYLWNEALFEPTLTWYGHNYWKLPILLLQKDIIPNQEKEDFVSKLVKVLTEVEIPDDVTVNELRKHQFFSQLRQHIFFDSTFHGGGGRYINVNNNSAVIMLYLRNEPLDGEVVELINRYFNNGYEYGKFKDDLEELKTSNPSFVTQFNEIANQQNLDVNEFFKVPVESH